MKLKDILPIKMTAVKGRHNWNLKNVASNVYISRKGFTNFRVIKRLRTVQQAQYVRVNKGCLKYQAFRSAKPSYIPSSDYYYTYVKEQKIFEYYS